VQRHGVRVFDLVGLTAFVLVDLQIARVRLIVLRDLVQNVDEVVFVDFDDGHFEFEGAVVVFEEVE